MVVCPFDPYELHMVAHLTQIGLLMGRNAYFSNHWRGLFHSKLYGISYTYNCGTAWAFAHLSHMGLPMDWNAYIGNCCTDFLHSKFYGIVHTCTCAASWAFAHLIHMGWSTGRHISLKPLDKYSPFKVLWNCLDFQFCCVMVICPLPFDPYGLAQGSEGITPKPLDGFSSFEVLWNCLNL